MNFSRIIDSIHNELHPIYIGGCVKYIDKNFDYAWSKAIERFDLALDEAMRTKNFDSLEVEAQIYKQNALMLIGLYKSSLRGNKVENFLESLK